MNDEYEPVLITCSGVSNTGKLTTKVGETLLLRYPDLLDLSLSARSEKLQKTLAEAEKIVVLDGCSDCCGRKKIHELGFEPDIHLIATDCGIIKSGMDDPGFDEIEHLMVIVLEKLR
jgi:uncharacterized metal-binding protein